MLRFCVSAVVLLCARHARTPYAFFLCGVFLEVVVVPGHLVMCLGLWPGAWLSGVPRPPALVRRASPSPVNLAAPVGFPEFVVPFSNRGSRPWIYWVAARGMWRPAENRAPGACDWHPPRRGHWARSESYPFGATLCGYPWRLPPASVLSCVRCGGFACVDHSRIRSVSPRGIRLMHRSCFVGTQ